jgi:K+-sensing histidine kinase KdpD
LNEEKQELEKKYILVSLKLGQLKNCMKNLNHDLRSTLGGITGMIDLLLIEDKDQI